jgi:hypothetical protein
VKYMVLVWGNEDVWGDPTVDMSALIAEVDAFNAALKASGEMIAVDGLLPRPRSIRSRGGVPVVSDGPYLEAKEYVGSYFVLDVESEERALEIARDYPMFRHPSQLGGGVEVWPLMSSGAAPE